MRELIHNLQPTIYALIGISMLLVRPQRIRKEKLQSFRTYQHWPRRIILGLLLTLIFSFVISYLFTPTDDFVLINTVCIFALIALYLLKLFTDIKKAIKS